MKKRIISLLLVFLFAGTSASASVLGGAWIDGSSLLIGNETTLYQNIFLSDQSGVGLQTEYYAEYTPNENIRPVVVTGESIWGKRTISQAVQYMQNNGMYPMVGINASFFSFKTGVPMGHVITNGEITSKDATELDAVGFNEDGTGFISRLGIKTTAYFDEYEFDIAHVNKYCQATTTVMTMFTDAFGNNTNATSETVNIILGELDGKPSIGKTITGKIEEIKTASGSVDIPSGKIVLTINTNGGDEWIHTLIKLMSVGQTISIKNEATVDAERWNSAYNGLASEGKRILSGGEVASGLEAGAAPRTAVGVRENGNLIFYVIDGRQKGYSYGARQDTVAKRLKELGCIDALNLDGGGSTSMAGVYPGQSAASIINSPSEGSLRQVTNFIFLQNMNASTGVLGGLYLYPYSTHYLSGAKVQLHAGAIDSNFHYMDLPEIKYSMENDNGSITEDGVLTLSGTGEAVVNVTSGDISGGARYFTYETPTEINVYNKDTGKTISSISGNQGDVINLDCKAYNGKKYLESGIQCYNFDISPDVGKVENGVLTLAYNDGASGVLTVSAGEKAVQIPVSIKSTGGLKPVQLYPYSEISVEDDKIKVDMFSFNEHIDFEKSFVKVDGNIVSGSDDALKYEVDDRHGVIIVPISSDFSGGFHKILAKAQTTDGYAAINTYSIKNSVPESEFADINSHWAKDTIKYMNNSGIVSGVNENGKNLFKPDNYITRAEFAVMMCRYMNIDASQYENKSLNFADNNIIPSWAANYIKAMYENGIISGKQDGDKVYFAPNDKLTRAEAAAVIGRTLPDNIRVGSLDFKDASSIPAWASDNIAKLTNASLMSGYDDKTIRPNANVTRAEAVSLLFNAY